MDEGVAMNFNLEDDSPRVSDHWRLLSEIERRKKVVEVVEQMTDLDLVIEVCKQNGEVLVSFSETPPASRRYRLLDLEIELKEKVEKGIVLWHVPQQDKSKVRKLRGVQVKGGNHE